MRISIAAALIAVAAATLGTARAQSLGLDHGAHDRAVTAAKAEASCATCHPGDAAGRLKGRPDHNTCFSTCHAPAPARRRPRRAYEIAADRRPLCLVCHAADALDAAGRGEPVKLAVAPPPAARADHRVAMSHRAHAAASCGDCHRFDGRNRRAHDRCRGCHAKRPVSAAVAMTACASCHADAGRAPLAIAASPYSTRGRFSHVKHGPRVKGQRPCLTCHPGLDALTGADVPRVSKSSCTGCHDGAASFSTTEASCRRCHENAPVPAGRRRRATSRFRHEAHAGENATACVGCHPEGGAFDTSIGHTLCATAGCHDGAYAKRDATVCGTCHLGSEPWLDQHVDRPTRGFGDFGVRFDHAAHRLDAASCRTCHAGDPDATDTGLSIGHAGCSGATCHDATAPAMTACDGCHQPGARSRRRDDAAKRRWSVRQTFRHKVHRHDESGKPLACQACHTAPTKPGKLLPPPAKATCLGCHDGSPAFKATGHGCIRCHRR